MSVILINRQRLGDACSYADSGLTWNDVFLSTRNLFFSLSLKDSPDFRYLGNNIDIWNKESFIKRCKHMISLIASDILSTVLNLHFICKMCWNEERQTIWLFPISESLLIYLSYILAELCCKHFVFLLNYYYPWYY